MSIFLSWMFSTAVEIEVLCYKCLPLQYIGHIALAAVSGTTIMVAYLQPIWWSGTPIFNMFKWVAVTSLQYWVPGCRQATCPFMHSVCWFFFTCIYASWLFGWQLHAILPTKWPWKIWLNELHACIQLRNADKTSNETQQLLYIFHGLNCTLNVLETTRVISTNKRLIRSLSI